MNFYISSLMKESTWDLQCSVPARSFQLSSERDPAVQLSSVSCCGIRAILQHAGLSLLTPAAPLGFGRVWCSTAWPLRVCDLRWSQPAEIQPEAETEVCYSSGCSELEMGRPWISADGEAQREQRGAGGERGAGLLLCFWLMPAGHS